MGEKVTIMVLKVDLQCRRCYKKVKQVLCKFPQIRDQIYDEKANTVTIKVVCCDPEKMRGKIRCKGGDSIKSIEIKPPPKPKDPENSEKEPEKKTEKPTESEKKSEKPKETPPKSPAKQASPPEGFVARIVIMVIVVALATLVDHLRPHTIGLMVGQFMLTGAAAAEAPTVIVLKKTHNAQSCKL
ncbi:hypothetical protein E1A91_1Z012900v1 [Gossypium mustelinum]|uniref:HMA domain-containing protein n=1 Tax=Gossypium mustelinum TaxID=34275 RepID=A0A5C7J3N6_GOSMU|nr:hypothetical protein E1A91_1Z012900v1 [Gossypium mustelinum]